jgi:hypothetical protein
MSKLREKLSKWFLDTAKKLDEKTVMNNSFVIPPSTQPIIMYDKYHIEKIRAQHMINNATLDAYRHNVSFNVDEMIKHRLVDEISKVIYDSHKDEVKETLHADSPYNESTLFSLDVYVCKPQKKESQL